MISCVVEIQFHPSLSTFLFTIIPPPPHSLSEFVIQPLLLLLLLLWTAKETHTTSYRSITVRFSFEKMLSSLICKKVVQSNLSYSLHGVQVTIRWTSQSSLEKNVFSRPADLFLTKVSILFLVLSKENFYQSKKIGSLALFSQFQSKSISMYVEYVRVLVHHTRLYK